MAPSSEIQESAQWSLLPINLLEFISQKIADITNFARFRCVCRSWRQAANPLNLSPQVPWLLLPHDTSRSSRSFFSLSTQSIYTLDLYETRNHHICASSNGWVVMLDRILKVSLFNPLTRGRFHLPPLIPVPDMLTKIGDLYFVPDAIFNTEHLVKLEEMDNYFDCYASITPDPEMMNVIDGVVFFMVRKCPKIQYWRMGDVGWTLLDLGSNSHIKTIAFHKGKHYILDGNGNTVICDLWSSEKAVAVSSLKLPEDSCYYDRDHHLITAPEDLLLVTCWCDTYSANFGLVPEMCFEYSKLDESEGTPTWLRLEGVGDCTVFFTLGAFDGKGKSVSVSCSAPGFRRNCSYYVVPRKNDRSKDQQPCHIDLTIIGDRSLDVEEIFNTYFPSCTWITPSLY